jgi:hypothetical protein
MSLPPVSQCPLPHIHSKIPLVRCSRGTIILFFAAFIIAVMCTYLTIVCLSPQLDCELQESNVICSSFVPQLLPTLLAQDRCSTFIR